jgi:fused signal recognition particle receptor
VAEEPSRRRRLRDRLARSRLRGRIRSRGKLDDEVWDELEESLLLADVGMPTTTKLVERVRARAAADKVRDAEALLPLLEAEITALLGETEDRALHLATEGPSVWLLVGVNGVGKTTTIAKLAAQELDAGRRVLLASADTFRATAGEQLAHWAERLSVDIVQGQEGGDPGAVAFDAVESARARNSDVVLVDTAGRLHTKVNLMEELKKIRRIVERTPGALQEVLLVMDASTGQNGLAQAREFTDAIGVTGVVLTKLDGTAKGGVVLAVETELGVPVKLVGVGETADDLMPFDPADFAAALVG